MVGPNLSTSRSISNTPAEHAADHNLIHQVANLLDLTTAPILSGNSTGRGTYASRPATADAGYLWVQTDSAGGNLPGTTTRWNGATWDVIGISSPQLAPVGTQSNTWIMPFDPASVPLPTGQTLVAGAGGMYAMLLRPSRDITLAALGVDTGSTAANYALAVYRVDGTILTRLATTGTLAATGVANTFRRDALLSTAALSAGTTYYLAISSDAALSILSNANTNRIGLFIGGVVGEAPVLWWTTSFHPCPATVDTVANVPNSGTSIYHFLAGHSST